MFRRIPSLILILFLLLAPNLCAAEPIAVSSLRPVNPQELKPVLDLLTAGLEETPQIYVADDSTGGAEPASAIARSGGKVLLATRDTDPALIRGYPFVVYSTGTRNASDRRTVSRRVAPVQGKALHSGEWSYVKIDSTLRGRWLDLVIARAEQLKPRLILLAPALPSQGRVTRRGLHGFLEQGTLVPLHENAAYREQLDRKLKSNSDLPAYLRERLPSGSSVVLLDLDRIERGKRAVLQFLSEQKPGTTIVADAVEQRHLKVIAQAVKEFPHPILCCGSAGLFGELVSSGETVPLLPWQDQLRQAHPGAGKVLVIAGSRNERSLLQVQGAVEDLSGRVAVVKLSGDRERSVRAIRRAWHRAQTVILQGEFSSPGILRGLLEDERLQEELSLLMVFGGDTLGAALRSSRAGFLPTGQVAPQIPYGRMIRPGQPSLPMISKAGGFGPPEFLRDLLRQVSAIEPPRLAVTMGDPAGTGPELLLRALVAEPALLTISRLMVVGDAGVLARARRMAHVPLAKNGLRVRPIRDPSDAVFSPGVLNVLDLANVNPRILAKTFGPVATHQMSLQTRRHLGEAALGYLDAAIELASAGEVDGLMTLPVTKEDVALVNEGFRGHTEWLGEKLGTLDGSGEVSIALIHGRLRVLHVTMHRSLEEVVREFRKPAITGRILRMIRIADQMGRRYFGLDRPRIGVLGLNPHAGEGGLLGSEDEQRIQPAIGLARDEGLNVDPRPIPGDTAFTPGIREQYDFLIAMYHDQGHGPFKAIAGFSGINFTGNLAKVRTTPDHGTDRRNAYHPQREFEPTAQGVLAALHSAIDMISAERQSSAGLEENPMDARITRAQEFMNEGRETSAGLEERFQRTLDLEGAV